MYRPKIDKLRVCAQIFQKSLGASFLEQDYKAKIKSAENKSHASTPLNAEEAGMIEGSFLNLGFFARV